MKNLNVLEKSKGVLLFATNTDKIDYVSIAQRAERLINHYLNLPVTIVSGTAKLNNRYSIDNHQFEQWSNSGRHDAYSLSPYDQTLLLDCDYLVFDNNLLKILDTVQDYKIAQQNTFVDGVTPTTMGKYSLPTLWATVVAFNKTPKTRMLFDLIGRIERNYAYYRALYNIPTANFRNDYAFTIADNILNGYTQDPSNYLPWPIVSLTNTVNSIELKDNQLLIKNDSQGYVLPKQNLHVMSKAYLLSDNCEQLIKAATDARV